MTICYVDLREVLPELHSSEINAISLTASEDRRIDKLIKQLSHLESVTKKLQEKETTVSDSRALFDAVIETYSETSDKLSSTAGIVHSFTFENAVEKLQRGNSSSILYEESEAVKSLKRESPTSFEIVNEDLSFAERALKRQRLINEESSDDYLDTRFLVPISNICERLFSTVGYAFSQRRKGMNPVNLEWQLFLHFNSDLWGVMDVNKLLLH